MNSRPAAPAPTTTPEDAMPAVTLLLALVARLDLAVWTAGRDSFVPAGTRVIHHRGRVGDVVAVITLAGEVVTDLAQGALVVPAEQVEAYALRASDRHRNSVQRRDVLRALLRQA